MRARIITIGDEILNGQTVDTNSNWIGVRLAELSVDLVEAIAIADTRDAIRKALDESIGAYDWVFMTGGLGPTKDDITKKTIAEYFGVDMVFQEDAWNHLVELFNSRGREVAKTNQGQADIPANAEYLKNEAGTAPGMLFHEKGTRLVSMPGVPYEMKHIMKKHVLPKIQSEIKGVILNRHFRTVGVPESVLADRLEDFESNLADHMHLAYLPSPGQVKLRITGRGPDEGTLSRQLDVLTDKLRETLGSDLADTSQAELAEVVGRMLIERDKTLSVAESCTGGSIGRALVAVSGASSYFEGGVIAYSYSAKSKLLGVDPDLIVEKGAVSEEVVIAMAEGVRERFGSDYALATSGVAGPGGGTEEKPVGTVWMALAGPDGTKAIVNHFFKNRGLNIELTVVSALDMLRREMIGPFPNGKA